MVKCENEFCKIEASFNFKDMPRRFCSKHKLDNMINVKTKTCNFKPFLSDIHSHNSYCIPSEGGNIGLFITLVPKVYNNVFLFVSLTTLGTFIEF